MSTLAQDFAFLTVDVQDFARLYSKDATEDLIGRFGRDWEETAPVNLQDVNATATLAGGGASAVKRAILEAATRQGLVKSDDDINTMYAQTERDNYKRNKQLSGRMISVDLQPDLTPDPKTVGVTILDTLCEETAHVDNSAVKASVADIRATLAKVNVKAAEAFDAVGQVDWDSERAQPNLVQFAKALGITRNPARKRWITLDALLRSEAFATPTA